jgi:hypothetical protein
MSRALLRMTSVGLHRAWVPADALPVRQDDCAQTTEHWYHPAAWIIRCRGGAESDRGGLDQSGDGVGYCGPK